MARSGASLHPPTVVDRKNLETQLGIGIMRFQDGSAAMDAAAAEVLALARDDLPALTQLLHGDAASLDSLAERLGRPRTAVVATLTRLERAGYAKRDRGRIAITEHARRWIAGIWGPIERDSVAFLGQWSTSELAILGRFTEAACELQEKHAARVRASLTTAMTSPRARRERGGLSPAALRRVEAFVEAHLADDIDLPALAERAGLSVFHFAREFKATTSVTPRAFVEQRRIARAKVLLRDTDHPVAQVALESGFTSQSRLTTVFRRSTGETPARYRAERRGDT